MSFSRFARLLQRKQLWLARADMLGDPWEIALAGDQLDHVIKPHPITPLPLTGERRETAMERAARIIPTWRQKTFVSCWNASDYELHALWRIYCGPVEGVAVQSTLGKLHDSSRAVPIYKVTYAMLGTQRRTPTLIDLVTRKRQMFAYEQEVRLVYVVERNQAETPAVREQHGRCLDWNPESYADFIRVHPLADYTPTLRGRVVWSAMRDPPPSVILMCRTRSEQNPKGVSIRFLQAGYGTAKCPFTAKPGCRAAAIRDTPGSNANADTLLGGACPLRMRPQHSHQPRKRRGDRLCRRSANPGHDRNPATTVLRNYTASKHP